MEEFGKKVPVLQVPHGYISVDGDRRRRRFPILDRGADRLVLPGPEPGLRGGTLGELTFLRFEPDLLGDVQRFFSLPSSSSRENRSSSFSRTGALAFACSAGGLILRDIDFFSILAGAGADGEISL